MILTALKELAEREGLLASPDYQPCPVRWLLTVGPGGEPLGPFRDTLSRPAKGKGKVAVFDVPKRSKRTTQDLPELLVDKAEYVFGWAEEGKPAGRGRRRHRLYVEELEHAFEQTRDEALGALLAFFRAFDSGQVNLQPPEGWAPGQLFGFAYSADPERPRLISSRPAVAAYWGQRRKEREAGPGGKRSNASRGAAEEEGAPLQCLVTGAPCTPVRLHPRIQGLPPASATRGGVRLTSTNAPAFESYGLGRFGCATVSSAAADACEKALNRLLGAGHPSAIDGSPLPARHFRLSTDSVVAFWSKGPDQAVDLFAESAGQGRPEAVEALFKAAWKGRPVRLDDPAAFYALTLSGARGRGTVRGWLETTLGAALRNVRGYFGDLRISRPPADEGKPLPLAELLRQLAVRGKAENVPAGLAGEVFAAVLARRPFPRLVLDAAVRRTRAERNPSADRVALLKAYLLRARRAGWLPLSFPEVHPVLDEECQDPAYRLGRLFAVLEKAQADAAAGPTIRERYYGAASATPVAVFPQLLRKAPHHLARLSRGSATYYEKLIQSVCAGLQPPAPFPAAFSLEEQGLFIVGYYHQREALFTKRGAGGNDPQSPAQGG